MDRPMAKSKCVLLLRFASSGSIVLQFGAVNSNSRAVTVSLERASVSSETGAASAHVMQARAAANIASSASAVRVEGFNAISIMILLLLLLSYYQSR